MQTEFAKCGTGDEGKSGEEAAFFSAHFFFLLRASPAHLALYSALNLLYPNDGENREYPDGPDNMDENLQGSFQSIFARALERSTDEKIPKFLLTLS